MIDSSEIRGLVDYLQEEGLLPMNPRTARIAAGVTVALIPSNEEKSGGRGIGMSPGTSPTILTPLSSSLQM